MSAGAQWKTLGPWQGLPATVYPLNDLCEHDPDSESCWCGPTYDNGALVHHAMDRREEYERGRRLQ